MSYRLLDVEWTAAGGRLGFGFTSYFETFDVCEAVAHEFAEGWLRAGRKRPGLTDLLLRRRIADPFDLAARPALLSIGTLTIRRDPFDGHRLYLHKRDAKSVASGPAVDPIDYEQDEPFRSFAAARDAGDFRIFATAVALFPLTLWAELLTIAVIEASAFDRLFAGMVSVNDEGAAVSTAAGRPTVGIPFTSGARERLRAEPLSPIAHACLEQAWQHRHMLLAC